MFDLITQYGAFSGLTINWDKSVIMPVDGQSLEGMDLGVPLVCSSTFKYLGVTISTNLAQYEKLNLDPLYSKLLQRLEVWRKLPLSVVGRVNLIKMIWMPQILYLLHNAPIWVPQRFFYKLNSLFRRLIWGKSVARIKLQALQMAKDEGGLAVPDPALYFLAAQLQHLKSWENVDFSDVNTAILRSYFQEMYLYEVLDANRCLVNAKRYPTLVLMHKVWWKLRDMYSIVGCTSYTPIWNTPWLPELCKLEDFSSWQSQGVRRVSHLITGEGDLKQFSQLQSEYALPHSAFYKYLQLRHAFTKEDSDVKCCTKQFTPVDVISNTGTSRGLISLLYKFILGRRLSQSPIDLKTKWEGDIGPIEQGIWEDILQMIPKISVSEQHRFIARRNFCTGLDYVIPLCVIGAMSTQRHCCI